MRAVAENGGRIRAAVAGVKSLASAICIGGGGSVGREGPIVQIGSALGSSLGQRLRVAEPRLKLLVACGAATFNAPIAGVLFALELLLRDFSAESSGVVLLASVTADVIGRAAYGPAAFLSLPPFAPVAGRVRLLCGARTLRGGGRSRIHPCSLWPRGPRRSGLARARVAAASGGRAGAGARIAGPARDVWCRLSRAGQRHSRAIWTGAADRVLDRQDRCDVPDHRHRRLGGRLRANPVHGRHAGDRVWRLAARRLARLDRARRSVRPGRHGRR